MMSRMERAKQFIPFDAMKGLQEELRERERRRSRVERHDISEEAIEENSAVLLKLRKGSLIRLDCHRDFHDITLEGAVSEINLTYKFLKLNGEKIFFEDIYHIEQI